jgi:hypothetical protein
MQITQTVHFHLEVSEWEVTVYVSKLMIYNGLILLQCQDHVADTIMQLVLTEQAAAYHSYSRGSAFHWN